MKTISIFESISHEITTILKQKEFKTFENSWKLDFWKHGVLKAERMPTLSIQKKQRTIIFKKILSHIQKKYKPYLQKYTPFFERYKAVKTQMVPHIQTGKKTFREKILPQLKRSARMSFTYIKKAMQKGSDLLTALFPHFQTATKATLGATLITAGAFLLQMSGNVTANMMGKTATGEEKNELQIFIDNAMPGETLDLSGKYFENTNITLTENIRIIGDQDTVFQNVNFEIAENISAEFSGVTFRESQNAILAQKDSSFIVSNTVFKGGQKAISGDGIRKGEIRNSYFNSLGGTAITLINTEESYIGENTFEHNRVALALTGNTGHIANNYFANNTQNSIKIENDKSYIYNNKFHRVYYGSGIHFAEGEHSTQISGNLFYDMDTGISSITAANTAEIFIFSNAFEDITTEKIITPKTPEKNMSNNNSKDVSAEEFGCSMVECF